MNQVQSLFVDICMCTDAYIPQVIQATAVLEAEFAMLLARHRKTPIQHLVSNRSTTHLSTTPVVDHDILYEHDTPDHITLPEPLDPSMIESILTKLLSIIQQHRGGGAEPETNDQWQAQVT